MPLTQPLRCEAQLRQLSLCNGRLWFAAPSRPRKLLLAQTRILRTLALPSTHHRVTPDFPSTLHFSTSTNTASLPLRLPPPYPHPLRSKSLFMATQTTQTRAHAGHGHGHHHHHDNTYLLSANKNDAGVRITRIGLMVNLSMAIGKFIGGYMFHSQALVADAYHALTDLVSDFMTLGTVAWSLKPPTERFPHGYGKIESLGALGVSSLLLCGGVLMGLNAGQVLLSQFAPEAFEALAHWGLIFHGHSHGHAHGVDVLGPNINAAWLAAGSIVVKEWLYRATMKVAKERKSSVLASNAVHHRIDSLTSIVALVTIAGAHVISNAAWLDPVGGLIISLMVIQAGYGNTKTALFELADTTVGPEIKSSVRKAALKALTGHTGEQNIEIRDVEGIKSGQNYLMEVEIAAPRSWSIERTREVEEAIRAGVGSRVRGVRRVRVRFVPDDIQQSDFMDEFIPGDVSPRGSPEPEDAEEHHHEHAHDAHEKTGAIANPNGTPKKR